MTPSHSGTYLAYRLKLGLVESFFTNLTNPCSIAAVIIWDTVLALASDKLKRLC